LYAAACNVLQVLKFGALIVDALVQMKQPVFVLIPPHGELRGGAWVVIDPAINPLRMEMFADPTSRGGILEPTGTVEIKFRSPQLFETMKRLDPECAKLETEIREATSATSCAQLEALKEKLKQRQAKLLPVYQQIAVSFAALHDTPSRMLAKACVNGIIPWADSRQFLYWRLRRRLFEDQIIARLAQAVPSMPEDVLHKTVKTFVISQVPPCATSHELGSELSISDLIHFDRSIVAWLLSSQPVVDKFIVQHRKEVVRTLSKSLAQENFAALVDGMADALEGLEGHERSSAIIQLFTKLTGREKGVGALKTTSPTLSHRPTPAPSSTPSRMDLNAHDAAADTASQQWSVAQVLRSMMDGSVFLCFPLIIF
jgi:acetyl-CoA carboxylase/biotin carboxylase 1